MALGRSGCLCWLYCCHIVYAACQVPGGRASVLEAYGEIILRGWRAATGPCLMEIEQHLIQVMLKGLVSISCFGRTTALQR
jgi:hypothetical protein